MADCGCGKKKQGKSCDSTRAVVEINNPEKLVLFRKVTVPASLGDDTTYPATIGKYSNVLLYYEANDHLYIYSSDGIPTLASQNIEELERALEEETGNRVIEDTILQQEIDAIKNAPDVVDIVATYADLLNYDTSKLSDNDIIRVLTDETHDDASSYYQWVNNAWSFIGVTGPYYTESEVNQLLSEKQDNLTAGNNITIDSNNVISSRGYTAGAGLNLINDEFSVNNNVVALQSDIPTKTSDLTNDGTNGVSPFAEVNDLPTKTSDLTNDGSDGTSTYVEADDLATVAFSGDASDLSNLPTVGNATLTIEKNGTAVGTFTANSTTDTDINITVPTNASDIGAQPEITSSNKLSSNLVDDTNSANKFVTTNDLATLNSALQPADINKVVMTDISLNATTSTTTVQIDGAKENLMSGATSTKNVVLPVASTTQAGVMNSATFDAVTNNTSMINALTNGAVAVTGISANPSQADITTAWQIATGLTTLMNRASVYDVTNSKVWTYYTNDTTWHAVSNTTQVTVNTFTNTSEGVIKGSTNTGQVFAENDGTGSVNGWDTLSNSVSTNTSNISSLQTAVAGKQDTLTAGNNITISGNTISADDTVYTAGSGLSLSGNQFSVDNTIARIADLPTVNDATLTIQNDGTTVNTFTANSASNVTANIIPPVKIGSVITPSTTSAYVDTRNIMDNAVTSAKLATDSVTTAKIADDAVTTAKVADGAITSDKIDFTTLLFGNYSLQEVDTGFVWTDGKHIYKKTIDIGNLPNNSEKQVAHGITSIDTLILPPIGAVKNNIGSVFVALPNPGMTNSASIEIWVSNTSINITTGTDRSALSGHVTLYYTKSN